MNTFVLTRHLIGGLTKRPTGFVFHYGPFETKEAAVAYATERDWLKEAFEVHELLTPEEAA